MPIGERSAPATCAENIAASPNAATWPVPWCRTAPCNQPTAASCGVVSVNCAATLGRRTTTSSPMTNSGSIGVLGWGRKAWPVNVVTLSMRSPADRPLVIGWDLKEPSARVKIISPSPLSISKPSRRAYPLVNNSPKCAASSLAAPGNGIWSAIRRREPPLWTQVPTALISDRVKADGFGSIHSSTSSSFSALEITRMRAPASDSSVNSVVAGRTM
ncbi:uncharacterized protein METZ01_LOCUS68581 [marine metagenome]|uniref:Uncharacterized protein n=1 Tax=marine metagenome TaxID=408172 RepID=A0A381TLS1_9ZZZZ